jgi:hypothetical protein
MSQKTVRLSAENAKHLDSNGKQCAGSEFRLESAGYAGSANRCFCTLCKSEVAIGAGKVASPKTGNRK